MAESGARKIGVFARELGSKAQPYAESVGRIVPGATGSYYQGKGMMQSLKQGVPAIGDFLSGLFGVAANADEIMPEDMATQPAQSGGGTQQKSSGGILEWMKNRPELMKGLLTAGIGWNAGFNPLEAAGVGGQAYAQDMTETQRRIDENKKFMVALSGKNVSVTTDPVSQISKELELYGTKLTPEQRQQYISLRLAGKMPTLKGGLLGKGFQ